MKEMMVKVIILGSEEWRIAEMYVNGEMEEK